MTTGGRYLEANRRVREAFGRHELANVLTWAFEPDDLLTAPDDEIGAFLADLRGRVASIAPEWLPAFDAEAALPASAVRAELAEAFPKVRGLAADVAAGRTTEQVTITISLLVPDQASDDRDGRPRRAMYGRLGDVVVWLAHRLIAEVPRSQIRACRFAECPRVYIATKGQLSCPLHQRDAARQAQRAAERAWRARQRTKKKATKNTTRRKRK